MDWLVRKKLYIYYTLFHTLGYYIWLYFLQNNDAVYTTGEYLFLLAAPLTSSIILFFFPITTLKIPKPFNQDIMGSQKDKALVETMIYLGHSLGLSVIAEGIESKEQLLFLKQHHCDIVQGDLYSKPLTVMQVSALIENRTPA
ncbi:EAL domain-containing protein [Neobacillus sp. NPDC093182]|uniref:EAL domain-containing protein n=1 Tax=Neobacillus sp. NPDC093182 TaxID=3364297 RepID=UPI003815C487